MSIFDEIILPLAGIGQKLSYLPFLSLKISIFFQKFGPKMVERVDWGYYVFDLMVSKICLMHSESF